MRLKLCFVRLGSVGLGSFKLKRRALGAHKDILVLSFLSVIGV